MDCANILKIVFSNVSRMFDT